jgi:DNA-binding response OmpR family regulator
MRDQRTILLVDDDAEIRSAMQTALENLGYRILTAADGNRGAAMAERDAPDLVVVDMMMPGQSGLLLLEKLKGRHLEHPRVIMITANEGGRHRAHAESLGVDDYIRKPFALERLLDSVQRLCPLPQGVSDASGQG